MLNFIPLEELQMRHSRLADLVGNGSIIILTSAGVHSRNSDVEYPFRQNSSFWYLTGIDNPDCVAIFVKNLSGELKKFLFVPAVNLYTKVWSGSYLSPEEASRLSGFDEIREITSQFSFSEILSNPPKIYLNREEIASFKYAKQVEEFFDDFDLSDEQKCTNSTSLLKKLRIEKSAWEIDQLRVSAQINVRAFSNVKNLLSEFEKNNPVKAQPFLQNISKPQLWEYQIEAEILNVYKQNGLEWSYPPIVAAGKNATTLHYTRNNSLVSSQDIILIDSGCEFNYYASDVTRTYPFGGNYTSGQKAIYDLVLKANNAILDKLVSIFGNTKTTVSLGNGLGVVDVRHNQDISIQDLQKICIEILAQGLIDMNLLSGSLDEVITTKSYSKYYMHGVSHWLGLDVHDLGDYKDENQKPLKLQPGHVFTVEPGIYLPVDDESIPPELRGIGVRIEDDVVITQTGIEILTEGIEK